MAVIEPPHMRETFAPLPMNGVSTTTPNIRSIVGGLVGNTIEWYDFLTYSIFSIYFAKAFFPRGKHDGSIDERGGDRGDGLCRAAAW